jgi:mono/diheme cytochrome c family protein
VHRPTRPLLACCALLAIVLGGCGRQIEVPKDSPEHRGAVLFQQRCSGCHTLTPAGAAGSKPLDQRSSQDRTNGPNLDQRVETVNDVLFAIRNGGFSGAIMPANVVVGQDAQDVAEFVAKYAGGDRPPGSGAPETDTGGAAEKGGESSGGKAEGKPDKGAATAPESGQQSQQPAG